MTFEKIVDFHEKKIKNHERINCLEKILSKYHSLSRDQKECIILSIRQRAKLRYMYNYICFVFLNNLFCLNSKIIINGLNSVIFGESKQFLKVRFKDVLIFHGERIICQISTACLHFKISLCLEETTFQFEPFLAKFLNRSFSSVLSK